MRALSSIFEIVRCPERSDPCTTNRPHLATRHNLAHHDLPGTSLGKTIMPDSAQPQLLHLVIGGELPISNTSRSRTSTRSTSSACSPIMPQRSQPEGEGAADRGQRPHALLRGSPPPAARSRSRDSNFPLKRIIRDLLRSNWVQRALGVLAAEYLRLVWLTNRFVYEPTNIYDIVEPEMPAIFAFWHGQHFMTPFIKKNKAIHRAKVLISRHRDGEFNAIAAERLGIGTIRGSGDHGGAFHPQGRRRCLQGNASRA